MEYTIFSDEYFMQQAIKEAKKAAELGEVPVGAIVVHNNKIVAKGHNFTETLNDVTAHAEIQAITSATNFSGSKYLPDCTLYVTLEPCLMCAGALFWSQMAKVVYGADDTKNGYSKFGKQECLHPKTVVVSGILADECVELLTKFFKKKRKKKE